MIEADLDPDRGILHVRPSAPLDVKVFLELAALADPFVECKGRLPGLLIELGHFPAAEPGDAKAWVSASPWDQVDMQIQEYRVRAMSDANASAHHPTPIRLDDEENACRPHLPKPAVTSPLTIRKPGPALGTEGASNDDRSPWVYEAVVCRAGAAGAL